MLQQRDEWSDVDSAENSPAKKIMGETIGIVY
jgi:hypothetical protein